MWLEGTVRMSCTGGVTGSGCGHGKGPLGHCYGPELEQGPGVERRRQSGGEDPVGE